MLFSQVSRVGSLASSRTASRAVSRGDTSHDRGKDMAGRVVAMAALRSKNPTLHIRKPHAANPYTPHPKTPRCKSQILHSKSQTQNPKPQILHSKPETLKPRHCIFNPTLRNSFDLNQMSGRISGECAVPKYDEFAVSRLNPRASGNLSKKQSDSNHYHTNHKSPITSHKSQITNHKSQIANRKSQIARLETLARGQQEPTAQP
jgi:hypothetical protein